MNASPVVADPLDPAALRTRVDAVLAGFLNAKATATAVRGMPVEATTTLTDFLAAGGRRLRPVLCVTGWHAGGEADGVPLPVLRAAASLELFHAFTLIHHDVIDRSASRRGRPSVHHALAVRHQAGRTRAGAGHLGISTAILVGDLAMAWSDELLHTAGLTTDQLAKALPVIDTMRTEVILGRYLDVVTTGRPSRDLGQALRIIRYKTAKYTVERPLHLGAALAGADARTLHALSTYALPLGEAFQLRDDLLGVFGPPREAGRPRPDELREGRHTALLALALQRADATQRRTLQDLIGAPSLDGDDAARIRDVLTATGARSQVEHMIRIRCRQAQHAVNHAAFPPHAAAALHRMIRTAAARSA